MTRFRTNIQTMFMFRNMERLSLKFEVHELVYYAHLGHNYKKMICRDSLKRIEQSKVQHDGEPAQLFAEEEGMLQPHFSTLLGSPGS